MTTKASVEMENILKSTAAKGEDNQTTSNTIQESPNDIVIDADTVQVRASWEELNQRIQAFIERKRQQVNVLNIQEFCYHRSIIRSVAIKEQLYLEL